MNDIKSIETSIQNFKDDIADGSNGDCISIKDRENAISALKYQQANPIESIEFLKKVKTICHSKPTCHKCPVSDLCTGMAEDIDEADLVRKVMEYRLEESIC